MEIVFLPLFLSYLFFTLGLKLYWKRIKPFYPNLTLAPKTFLTVIIPIRNEADNILDLLSDIENQEYPKHLFEVLIVDDLSTDKGPDMVRSFQCGFDLHLLQLPEGQGPARKKNAISLGIKNAKGTFIVTTDGDCRVGRQWLSSLENFYRTYQSKFIFGGVTFFQESSVFEQMQTVEFASLTGSGAACLRAGYPNMCNGANLAYEKEVFLEVSGYAGFDHIPSGDDEFLMHKIYSLYPDKVHFIKSKSAIVQTRAKTHLNQFFNQRKRWAGKWKYYKFKNIKVIAFYIFTCNAALIIALGLTTAGKMDVLLFSGLFLIKIVPDYLFIKDVLIFYGKKINPFIFIITCVFYPFYVSFFAISSNIGKYTWKGRDF